MAVPHGALDMVIGHFTAAMDGAAVLAHQGGWDELLMVLGPIVIFAVLLRTANRRASRLEEEAEEDGAQPPAAPPTNPRRGPI